jgi:pre-mRNA-splicing factor CWC22
LCQILLDISKMQQAYDSFYGFVAERCCSLKKEYKRSFEKIFQNEYKICHRIETFKLRNTAKFFTHLIITDAIS